MRIERRSFDSNRSIIDESIFNCSNGKLGVRGCFEEGSPYSSIRGTYLNGFAEKEPLNYNENFNGFSNFKETIVNLPDTQTIEVFASGNKINCWSNNVKDYLFSLNMDEGLINRHFIFETKQGNLDVNFTRFSSFKRDNLFSIRCFIKSIDFEGKININSILNADVKNFTATNDPRVASGSGKLLNINYLDNVNSSNSNNIQVCEVETINSKRKVLVLSSTIINKSSNRISINSKKDNNQLIDCASFDFKKGEEFTIDKYSFYKEIFDSNYDYNEFLSLLNISFNDLKYEQIQYMDDFWKKSRILIDSNEIKQENVDFCLYSLLSSVGKDSKTSIAAKGLSGEGYEGHYFWDCETYIYPFFLYTNKDIAKSLLMYRYSKLDEAKKHAKELGHQSGALYPWRTISGFESSSYYPSGSAQYHINGDIARAFVLYYIMHKDEEMLPIICEVLLETSRLWIDVGHFDNGLFKIDCVTGPDEYTCLVNNNYYTNAGAAFNLYYASKLIKELKNSNYYNDFVNKTNFKEDELEIFTKACKCIYLPYDSNLNIIKQDDSFLDKKKVNLNDFPKENFPLLLHYHPLYLYRLQVCKQADAVLADCLFENLNSSSSKRTFDYYENITTHDSSLSKCIFGIASAKLGDLDKAKQYFIETLSTDLDDEKGNTRDGLHMANMGGSIELIVSGFAGLRINDYGFSLFPMLPNGINSYSFPINYQDVRFLVFVNNNGLKLYVENPKDNVVINVYGQKILLNQNEIVVKRKIKGVIFDLDGVITDTAIYHFKAWKRIADELNVEFDEKKNEQFKGVSRNKCLELLLSWKNIKVNEKEFNNILDRKNEYYKEYLKNITPNNVLHGVLDTIKYLKDKGLKISIFSVSRNTDTIIDKLNIRDYFDVIVNGNDVKNSKPHFDGYLLAADRMGITPRLCCMVEDSRSGIKGAKDLGLKTIAIMKENVENADICIKSTNELINAFENL